MATVTVMEDWQVDAVLAAANAAVDAEGQKLWRHVKSRLPEVQERHWDRRFGIGVRHKPKTVEARIKKRRKSYYGRESPGGRASADHPYFEWTGELRKATQRITRQTTKSMLVAPDRNYTGPLLKQGILDPFRLIVDRKLGKDRIWDTPGLEKAVDAALEQWLNDNVVPSIAKKIT